MATRMASRDCEGQSEPINGTMLRDKKNKIRIKSHIMLLVTFIPALPKMSLCVCVCFMFACFPSLSLSYCLCNPVMTVCCQCIGCTGGGT